VRAKGWVGYVLPQHALPAKHLTIESRMNEQKKAPIDPMPMRASHEVGHERTIMLTSRINSCKPDAKKKKSPH